MILYGSKYKHYIDMTIKSEPLFYVNTWSSIRFRKQNKIDKTVTRIRV